MLDKDLVLSYSIRPERISKVEVYFCQLYGKDYYKIYFTNGRIKILKEL